MNFSKTTHSLVSVYGIKSVQENRAASETNQRFFGFVFRPTPPTAADHLPLYPNNRFSTLPHGEDLRPDFATVRNISELGKYEREAGILAVSDRQPYRWQLLKKLEGNIVRATKGTFTVHLRENESDVGFIETEFDLSELPEQERSLAVEGASLVWTISRSWQGGTMKRESVIYLRRLPNWTPKEAAEAEEQARYIADAIQWE